MADKPPDPAFPPTVGPAGGAAAPETRADFVPPSPEAVTPGTDKTWPDAGPRHPPQRLPVVPGYEILGELGRGGMGVVYQARHLALKRVVALKMIKAGEFAGATERARFKAEAEAAARLSHPNIVQIFDVDEAGGYPFCALEFVDGGSLAQKLAGRPQAPRQAAELVQSLARAMDLAHSRGIVHRDLKPANVLLACSGASQKRPKEGRFCEAPLNDGVPKISDFGLARQLDADSGQTHSGQVVGTPSYMAPEQAAGLAHEAGPPADVYALGAILYECLTGQPPFKGASVAETLEQVRSQDPVAPRRLNPSVPRDLETICLKCLRKEPAARYATAGELADDLHRFLNFEPIRARRVGALERGLKWIRRRPAIVLAGLVVVLLLIGVPVGYQLWQERDKARRENQQAEEEKKRAEEEKKLVVEHRPSVTLRWAVPQGSGRLLTPEQARRRSVTYRVTRRGPRVEQVDILNGHGAPTTFHPYTAILQPGGDGAPHRECAFRVRRDNDGNFIREEALDRNGQLLWSFRHATPPSETNLTSQGWYLDNLDQVQRRSAAGASHVRFTWSREGLAQELRFFDAAGTPRPDDNGVYGQRLEHNEHGQVTRITFLGPAGQPAANREGVVSLRNTYDRDGNVRAVTVFDIHDRPTHNRNGIHKIATSLDEDGNLAHVAFFDKDSRPVPGPAGCHALRARFNDSGDYIESRCFGVKDEPVTVGGIHRTQAKYDTRGNRIEEAYFGLRGERVADVQGVARRTSAYNERGDLVELACFGTDNKPLLLREGYHRYRTSYDSQGRQTSISYFGVKDEPVRLPVKDSPERSPLALDADQPAPPETGGYHKLTLAHDKHGRVTEVAYFDVDGKSMTVRPGFHREVRAYEDGIEVSYFDAAGRKTLHRDGYHRWKMQAINHGNTAMRLRAFFDRDGNNTVTRFGVSSEGREYNPESRELTLVLLSKGGVTTDSAGKVSMALATHRDGYSMAKASFDDKRRILREDYFGPDQKPIVTRRGFARITRAFDPATGKLQAETFWVLDNRGEYARVQLKRDAQGRVLERALFDEGGKTVLHPGGYHREVFKYDAAGRLIETAYFGRDRKPALTVQNVSRVTFSYDAGKRSSETIWVLDYRGNYARVAVKRDARGRVRELAYFSADGTPTHHPHGDHKYTVEYDTAGREIERAYFGEQGQPITGTDGYARVRHTFNEAGHWTDVTLFDAKGKQLPVQTFVGQVTANGRGAQLGLKVGDVLLSYGGAPVVNPARFQETRWLEAAKGDTRELKVRRGDRTLTFALPPGDPGMVVYFRAAAQK
jgi:hypothetical protein